MTDQRQIEKDRINLSERIKACDEAIEALNEMGAGISEKIKRETGVRTEAAAALAKLQKEIDSAPAEAPVKKPAAARKVRKGVKQ